MPIPTKADYDIAEIRNSADLVVLSLGTLRHSGPRMKQHDLERQRRLLRERLQQFCDEVIEMANAL